GPAQRTGRKQEDRPHRRHPGERRVLPDDEPRLRRRRTLPASRTPDRHAGPDRGHRDAVGPAGIEEMIRVGFVWDGLPRPSGLTCPTGRPRKAVPRTSPEPVDAHLCPAFLATLSRAGVWSFLRVSQMPIRTITNRIVAMITAQSAPVPGVSDCGGSPRAC